MGRGAVVITFDYDENSDIANQVEPFLEQARTVIRQEAYPRVWLGIYESAEAIMQVTGESRA